MKKITFLLALVLVCALSLTALAACDTSVTGLTVKTGTLADSVVQGETYDTSTAVVTAAYSDGSSLEVTASDLEFSTLDTTTLGEKTLTISFGGCSVDYRVTVVEADAVVEASSITVYSLSSTLLTEYSSATSSDTFADTDVALYAGDDNSFHFDAYAVSIDSEGDDVTYDLGDILFEVSVSILDDTKYVAITDDSELAGYVTINDDGTFDFTSDAVGETFQITVTATNAASGVANNAVSFTGIVTVVDGYNVYDALDLSVYNNADDLYGWEEFKQGTKVEGVTANSIVLQKDIVLTDSDIPEWWFWTQEEIDADADMTTAAALCDYDVVGSLKDKNNGSLFTRELSDGDQFVFYGNYFSVDASGISVVVVESDNKTVATEDNDTQLNAHTVLFGVQFVDLGDDITVTQTTDVLFTGLQLVGNGTNDGTSASAGSLILMEARSVDFTAYNIVANNSSFAFLCGASGLPDGSDDLYNHYVVDSCRMYNFYQNFIYAWGASSVLICDSEMMYSGGPAIISDELQYGGDSVTRSVCIDIVNSNIYSPVNGTEAWFVANDLTTVATDIWALERLIPYIYSGYTLVCEQRTANEITYDYANAICIMKLSTSSSTQSGETTVISGYTRIFDSWADYEAYYDETNPDTTVTYGLENTGAAATVAYGYNTTALHSSGSSGYVYMTSTTTYATVGECTTAGDYLNIYFNMGGLIVGLCESAS